MAGLRLQRELSSEVHEVAGDEVHDAVVALCEGLVAARMMRAGPDEIRALARNVLVVATYWLNFRALPGLRREPADDIGEGAYQVMALVAPYLVGPARTHLDRLGRTYID